LAVNVALNRDVITKKVEHLLFVTVFLG